MSDADATIPTQTLRVNPDVPEPDVIARAAEVLRAGGLVGFPTETVYGLGANAFDARAVARIFAAKGRPANNPLIVHVPDHAGIAQIAAEFPENAEKLAAAFWPGPLTLVLPRTAAVPDIVTAGGDTVAVRVPAHPVAQALLRAAGVPVAAPSANRSQQVSPTTAAHVTQGLSGRIEMVLDGGATSGGIESTVLDMRGKRPTLLRPGLIAPAQIEAIVGPIRRRPLQAVNASDVPLASPGQMARHYAPHAPLEVNAQGFFRVQALMSQGEQVGWLTFPTLPGTPLTPEMLLETTDTALPKPVLRIMPRDPAAYAARLYAILHELDALSVTRIVVDAPPDTEEWLGIRDRLRRAATSSDEKAGTEAK